MKASQPTVLLIIPNLGRGGAQRVFHQQRALLTNVNVVSVVFNFDGAFESEQVDGTISLEVPAGKNWWQKLWNFRQRVIRLRAIKKQYKVDVAISHLEGADYVNLLSGQGERRILWIHGSKWHDLDIQGVLGKVRLRFLLPWLYRRADDIVCVSEGIKNELTQRLPSISKKLTTIQNGVDIQAIDLQRNSPIDEKWDRLFRDNFVIVTHCRLAAQKNLRGLLNIVEQLKHLPKVKWMIVGDGEQRTTLLAESNQRGISVYHPWASVPWTDEATLYFTGFTDNPYSFLTRAQLYVLPSLWEGFPLAVCEAIVCGIPVIASDCHTGPREILAPELKGPIETEYVGKYGILMPVLRVDDHRVVQQWISTFQRVIDNPTTLESFRDAAQHNRRQFSLDSVKEQLNALVHRRV